MWIEVDVLRFFLYVPPGSLLMAAAMAEESMPVEDMFVAEDVGIIGLRKAV